MTKASHDRRVALKELLNSRELVNATVMSEDGGMFKVHLEVLVGKSPYFRRIIGAAKSAPWESILIAGTSRETIANVINFMYTSQLTVSFDRVKELLDTGELLAMPEIIQLCKRFLTSSLSDEKCIAIFNFSKTYRYEDLKETARTYILAHFQQVFPVSSDYLKMEEEDLMGLLSCDKLNVNGEEYVFWAIMRWVESDPTTRTASLPCLLRCIRFGLCNRQFYERNVCPHPLVSGSEECQAIVLQASQLFLDIRQGGVLGLLDVRHPFLRPRVPREIIFVMGGWSAGSATNVIETFDVKSGRWFLSLATDNVPRAYHGMLWHGDHIYVIGGFDGNQCFNTMRRYDPSTRAWEEKGCMYERRCYVSVAAVGECIYAMGGYDGHRRSRSCERYDPATNQWSMMANMNQVRSDASADAMKGKVYVAGGFNGQQVLISAECYDPATDEWTLITEMNTPRSGVKLVAYNEHLYVLGGFNGEARLKTVDKYDPRTRQWSPVPSMNGQRSNFAAAVLFDCLYVIGGFNGLATISAVECYNHHKNAWLPVTELNLNRSAVAACTVIDIPNSHEYTYLGNAP